MTIREFSRGAYRFVPAVFQYSGGVAAEPGFCIERVTFRHPLPLARGFERAEAIIIGRGRPLTAFCACELRSPLPFSDEGFGEFNRLYVQTLARWGIYDGNTNPVARSNVCPEILRPRRRLRPGAVCGNTATRERSAADRPRRGSHS